MSVRLEIRRARADELSACADLYVQVLRDTFTWQPPQRHRREDFLAAARTEEVYVAVEAGRIVGLAAASRSQRFLHSLYVTDRGRGIGKALLDHVRQSLGGPVSLKVQAPNLRAQAFYDREGWRAVERGRDPGSDVSWVRYVSPS